MSQQQTSVAERNHFVDLKAQGHTLQEIADATGWSFECVRRWWRRYRDGGRSALAPEDGRKQRGGRMSSFAAEIRSAFSEDERELSSLGRSGGAGADKPGDGCG